MRKVLILFVDAVIPIALIIAAVTGMRLLILTRPEAARVDRPPLPTLVEVISVPESSPQIRIAAFGTVEPAREVVVRPQVEGLVVEQNENLVEGGLLDEGEMLVRIDPRDYEYRVQQMESALVTAQSNLRMEEGRQVVAQREWELLESSVPVTETGRELALRVPFLEEKKAAVRSAESQLSQAKLSLERTAIRAPFNAIVIEESVDPGQLLSPQNSVARLVGTDVYYVEVSVPARYLQWVDLPRRDNGESQGSPVEISKQIQGGEGPRREGRIVGLLGDVDPNGRMARLRIELRDPLGLETDRPFSDPFLVGDYVRVIIQGPTIEHALELPRHSLREDEKVWVMSPEGTLRVKDIEVVYAGEETVVVKGDLSPDDQVIISSLTEAIPGMALTTESVTTDTVPVDAPPAELPDSESVI